MVRSFVAFLGVVYHLPGSYMGERANGTTSHMQAMGVLESARIMSVFSVRFPRKRS